MRAVHVVVPDGIDDPAHPSGGNRYDRRICEALGSRGWSVAEHPVPGSWPRPDRASLAALAAVVQRIPDGAVVLLDGLVACAAPEALVPEARRLRLVVLVHMPIGLRPPAEDVCRREQAVLAAAAAIVTTSAWTRRRLLEDYRLPAGAVHVAEPGVDRAELAAGTAAGGALLCVAAVTYDKGHDLLLDALAMIAELRWRCVCVGSLDRAPAFADRIGRRARAARLDDRVTFAGPRTGSDLHRSYAGADLLVLASRAETYGMVVTEALARGVPIVAADVGGLGEALGYGVERNRPGLLVAPGDPAELGAALRRWLGDAELRGRLRRAARERRESLSGWSTTAAAIERVLSETDHDDR